MVSEMIRNRLLPLILDKLLDLEPGYTGSRISYRDSLRDSLDIDNLPEDYLNRSQEKFIETSTRAVRTQPVRFSRWYIDPWIPELYKINISKESDVERLILLLIGRAIMNEPVNLLQTLANHALTNCRKCSSSLKSSYSVGQINKDLGSEEIRSRPTRPYSSISMHPECCSLQQRVRRPK